jgi:hypothetical protein
MFGWWRRRRQLQLSIGPIQTRPLKGTLAMNTLALLDNQHCPLAIQAVDAAGNPTALPAGSVTWTTSNSAVAAVTPSADGMTCDVAAVGPLGTAQIGVSVIVSPTVTLTGALAVTVGASAAASIQVVPGTPVNK